MGFPTKVQVISRKDSEQWYINFPSAVAQAMDFEKGETIEWVVADRENLIAHRRSAPPTSVDVKKKAIESSLLEEIERVIEECAKASSDEAHTEKLYRHILGQLTCLGRHTVTGMLCSTGQQYKDWSADYRLYSEGRFCEQSIFDQLKDEVCSLLEPNQPLVAVMDDTLLRKRGKKTPGVKYQRDPLSPPFHTNLVLSQRVVQISAAVPSSDGSAEVIPIDFIHAPLPQKPKRNASQQDKDDYEKARLKTNINLYGAQQLQHLRDSIDKDRKVIAVVDNRFTTSTLLGNLPQNITFIGRVRKDAHFERLTEERTGKPGRPKRYLAKAPTPQEVLKDDSIEWQEVSAFAAGQERTFRVKVLPKLYWHATGTKRVYQLLVVAPVKYRLTKKGDVLRRQPAFFMCSDPQLPVKNVLQAYLWRWGIECNFRDEKTLLGLGQAQVRSELSVQKAPALTVAAYAMLRLAALRVFRTGSSAPSLPRPKWQPADQYATTPTTPQLINQLRVNLWSSAIDLHIFRDFCASRRSLMNPRLFNSPLKSATFFATQ